MSWCRPRAVLCEGFREATARTEADRSRTAFAAASNKAPKPALQRCLVGALNNICPAPVRREVPIRYSTLTHPGRQKAGRRRTITRRCQEFTRREKENRAETATPAGPATARAGAHRACGTCRESGTRHCPVSRTVTSPHLTGARAKSSTEPRDVDTLLAAGHSWTVGGHKYGTAGKRRAAPTPAAAGRRDPARRTAVGRERRPAHADEPLTPLPAARRPGNTSRPTWTAAAASEATPPGTPRVSATSTPTCPRLNSRSWQMVRRGGSTTSFRAASGT